MSMKIQFNRDWVLTKSFYGTIDSKYHFNVYIYYSSKSDIEDISINWDSDILDKEYKDKATSRIMRLANRILSKQYKRLKDKNFEPVWYDYSDEDK